MSLPGADRWSEISTMLDAVLDLPPDERAAYLETACADDPALRGRYATPHDPWHRPAPARSMSTHSAAR